MRASPRAYHPSIPPDFSSCARGHDDAVWRCLLALLGEVDLHGQAAARAQLALRHGGLGLRSAVRHAPVALWASWADTLPALLKRDRPFALRIAQGLESASELTEALLPLQDARDSLSAVGFEPPSWHDLLHAQKPPQPVPDIDSTRGWQRAASQAVDGFCQRALMRELDASPAALLDSQSGPYAARVFTTRPTSPEQRLFFYKQSHIETRFSEIGRIAFGLQRVGLRRARVAKSTQYLRVGPRLLVYIV